MNATLEATEHLRAVLDEDQGNEKATLLLSTLLEKTGRDQELAELLSSQIELAREPGRARQGARLPRPPRRGLRDPPQRHPQGHRDLQGGHRQGGHPQGRAPRAGPPPRAARREGRRRQGAGDRRSAGRQRGQTAAVKTALRLADLYGALKQEDDVRRVLERGLEADALRPRGPQAPPRPLREAEGVGGAGRPRQGRRRGRQGDRRQGAPLPQGGRDPPAEAQRPRRRGRPPGEGLRALARRPRAAPRPLRRLQRLRPRQAGRRGPAEDRRLLRRPPLQGARRHPPPPRQGVPGRGREGEGARAARHRLQDRPRLDRRPARPRRPLARAVQPAAGDDKAKEAHIDRAQKTFRALLLQKLDDDVAHLQGRGLLLPGRHQPPAGRRQEGPPDAGARRSTPTRSTPPPRSSSPSSRSSDASRAGRARSVSWRAPGSSPSASRSSSTPRSPAARPRPVRARVLARPAVRPAPLGRGGSAWSRW